MTAQRMAQADALLSGRGGSLLTAPIRFLGHHVVSTLATRLGAHVELRPTEGSGVTAYIALPPHSSSSRTPRPSQQPREGAGPPLDRTLHRTPAPGGRSGGVPSIPQPAPKRSTS